jgi:metal-dependent amidase/aminoacylase/carboxypeptidase family protein
MQVQLLYAGINALRQHVKPDERMHGIITEGCQAANIVPDKASCLFIYPG